VRDNSWKSLGEKEEFGKIEKKMERKKKEKDAFFTWRIA